MMGRYVVALSVRDGVVSRVEPALGPMGMEKLLEQSSLPYARLPDDCDDLTVTGACSFRALCGVPPVSVCRPTNS